VAMFRDRRHAGAALGQRLAEVLAFGADVVLALPRGGVPVGAEVARALGADLDVFVVRKLGAPDQPELAMGAIASGGVRVVNQAVIDALRIDPEVLARVTRSEETELERRDRAYRDRRPPIDVTGRSVVIVDDGLATGATMRAAVAAVLQLAPAHLVVAVPTGAAATCVELAAQVDAVVCLDSPDPFYAVGLSYDDFSATTDDEVRALLASRNP
jgi:putative phosphoribosyl transferase